MITLYHEWDSVCSFKVRMCLGEKGLSWDGKHIDLPRFEHLRPEYLALNPNGVVPTLIHDGHVIIESTVINEYLDEVFPDPVLKPEDPIERAAMRVWVKYEDDHLHHSVRPATFQLMIKPRMKRMTKQQIRDYVANHPKPERAEAYVEWASGPVDEKEVAKSRDMLTQALERMELVLGRGSWLAGSRFSLADAAVAPFIDRIEHLRFTDLWSARPLVQGWIERIKARPSYAAALPPDAFRLPEPQWAA
jgi:glutathione S-transferase